MQRLGVLLLAVLVFAGIGWGWSNWAESVEQATSNTSALDPAPVSDSQPPAVISVLSDSHAYNADSWFRRTVEDGKIEGAALGVFASFPGRGVEAIRDGLDQVANSDVVIIQAGTNDILGAAEPAAVAEAVTELAADAQERADTVALALVPPSDQKPAEVRALDQLLREWAEDNDVPVIDVYTAVADEDGSWREGLTDDGVHANDEGSQLMADAALPQIEALID